MSGPERTVMFQLPSVLAGTLACVGGTLAGRSWELSAGTFDPNRGVNLCEVLARDMPRQDPDRFENILKLARRANVAINTVSPAGLQVNATIFSGSSESPFMMTNCGGQ